MTKEEAIHELLFEATHPKRKPKRYVYYKQLLRALHIDPELNIEQARVLMRNVPVRELRGLSMSLFQLDLGDVEGKRVEFNSNKPFGELLEDIYKEVIGSNKDGEINYLIHTWCVENLEGVQLSMAIHMLNGLYYHTGWTNTDTTNLTVV